MESGQFLECVFVEGPARLTGVRRDRVDRYFLEVGAVDLTQSSVSPPSAAASVDGHRRRLPERAGAARSGVPPDPDPTAPWFVR